VTRENIKSLLIFGVSVFGLIALLISTSGLSIIIVLPILAVLIAGATAMIVGYHVFRSKLL